MKNLQKAWIAAFTLGIALTFAGVALAGKGSAPKKITKKLPPEPAGFKLKGDAKKGKKVYKKFCKKCHGKHGDGGGMMAADLKPKPTDFTHPGMNERSDWELFVGVREGGAALGLSDKMTPWKDTLTKQEVHDVLTFIRTFAPKKKTP